MIYQALNHHRVKRNEKFHLGFRPSRTHLLTYLGRTIEVHRRYQPDFVETLHQQVRKFNNVSCYFVETASDGGELNLPKRHLAFEGRYLGLCFLFRYNMEYQEMDTIVKTLAKLCKEFGDDYMKNF